jgi:hypothetical protein
MNQLRFRSVLRCIAVVGVILAMTGCKSDVTPQTTTSAQPGTSDAKPVVAAQSSADELVPVKANCIVYHSGYDGIVVAPGVSEPSGTVASLKCSGKKVEITSSKMVKGIILTKDFGKVKVHFSSMVATVGAGDFTSDPGNGRSLPERVINMSVEKSEIDRFMTQFP